MEPTFRIVFQGKLQAGLDPTQVRQLVGARLKASPAQLETLFSGARMILKKNLSASSAQAYLHALQALGMQVTLESCAAETSRPTLIPVQPEKAQEVAPVILESRASSPERSTGTDALVNTLAPLDFAHQDTRPTGRNPHGSSPTHSVTPLHPRAAQPIHQDAPATLHPAEAPLLFRTSIVCTECGTRHIIEGRLMITATPADEPAQKGPRLR